jgi:hypothetical protein
METKEEQKTFVPITPPPTRPETLQQLMQLFVHSQSLKKHENRELTQLQIKFHDLMRVFVELYLAQFAPVVEEEDCILFEEFVISLLDFVVSKNYWKYFQIQGKSKYGYCWQNYQHQASIHVATYKVIKLACNMFQSYALEVAKRYVAIRPRKLQQWFLMHIVKENQSILQRICELNSGQLPLDRFVKLWELLPISLAFNRAKLELDWYKHKTIKWKHLKRFKTFKNDKSSQNKVTNENSDEKKPEERGDVEHKQNISMRDHNRHVLQRMCYRKVAPKRAVIAEGMYGETDLLRIIYRCAKQLCLMEEQFKTLTAQCWGPEEEETLGCLFRLYLDAPYLRKQISEHCAQCQYDHIFFPPWQPRTRYCKSAVEYQLMEQDVPTIMSTFTPRMLELLTKQWNLCTSLVCALVRKVPACYVWRDNGYKYLSLETLQAIQPILFDPKTKVDEAHKSLFQTTLLQKHTDASTIVRTNNKNK